MPTTAALTIRDRSTDGKINNEFVINFPVEEVTVRELISTRVSEEVDKHNIDLTKTFQGLIQPSDTEVTLNGFRLKKNKKVNKKEQIKKALDAFYTNQLIVLINKTQAEDLDDVIRITPNTVVTFLKLVPLVGG